MRGHEKYSTSAKVLSSLLWFMIVLNISFSLLGSVAVPLVIILFAAAAILSVTWKKRPHGRRRGVIRGTLDEGHYLTVLPSALAFYDDDDDVEGPSSEEVTQIKPEREGEALNSGVDSPSPRPKRSESAVGLPRGETGPIKVKSSVSFGEVERKDITDTLHEQERRAPDKTGEAVPRRPPRLKFPHRKAQGSRENSNLVFVVLLIAYFIVIFWKYPLFLFLLSPLALWAILKHALSLSSTLGERTRHACHRVCFCLREKEWLLIPPPLPTLMRMFLYADRRALRFAVQSTGSLVSAFIIIGLVVGVATSMVLLLLEVKVEMTHYFTVGGKVWNLTVARNPQFSE